MAGSLSVTSSSAFGVRSSELTPNPEPKTRNLPFWLRGEDSNLHFLVNSQARYPYATPQNCEFRVLSSEFRVLATQNAEHRTRNFLFRAAVRSRTCKASLRKRRVTRHSAARSISSVEPETRNLEPETAVQPFRAAGGSRTRKCLFTREARDPHTAAKTRNSKPGTRNSELGTRRKERKAGIEPASQAWRARTLPLSYIRICADKKKLPGFAPWKFCGDPQICVFLGCLASSIVSTGAGGFFMLAITRALIPLQRARARAARACISACDQAYEWRYGASRLQRSLCRGP